MDSVSSGKVVEDYDNKTHKYIEDDNGQMEAMLLTDEKLQKTGSVMEKKMGPVVGGLNIVEVNKVFVDEPGRVVEPECDGTVVNADQGLATEKHITEETNEAEVPDVKENCRDVPNEHKVCEESAKEGVVNNEHQDTFEVAKKVKRDDVAADLVDITSLNIDDQGSVDMPPNTVETDIQNDEPKLDETDFKRGLATSKHITEETNEADVPDVKENCRHVPNEYKVCEESAKEGVVNNDNLDTYEVAQNVKRDDVAADLVDITSQNIDDQGSVDMPPNTVESDIQNDEPKLDEADIKRGLETAKHITEETNEADVPEVKENFRDVPNEHKVCEESAKEGVVNKEHLDTYEVAEKVKRDDVAADLVDITSQNIDDQGSVDMPPNTLETDKQNNEPELDESDIKRGLVTAKHITEETNDADVPDVRENCRDVPDKRKVCEESAKEGVVNNEHLDTYEVAEKVKREDVAADLVDITSLNIDDQGSVDMPPNTVETDIQNDEPYLDEADIKRGLATAKHITEETNEADVPEVKENCRDVPNEHKVCEKRAKEGVVNILNNEHLDIYEVAQKVNRDDVAADLVDTNSVHIDGQGSVDMPSNTGQIDIQNDELDLDEAGIKTVTAGDNPYTSATTFEDLNLSAELLKGVYTEMGFQRPSKIQAVTLPMILRPPYLNLVAQAHNGSGKTTCFVLGVLSRIDPKLPVPQALCVCPTRELVIQNQEVLQKMGRNIGIGSICAIPTDIRNYVTTSKRAEVNEQVVIGTPGTVKKWISNKVLRTRYIKILVFDEADHMLAQDGFQDDSMRIIRDIQKNGQSCQILLFSATFNDNVKMFISRMIPTANEVFEKEEDLSLDAIKQYRVKCPSELAKLEVLKDRIFPLAEKLGQTIIFVRTRESASKLHSMLEAEGHRCTSMQGRLKLEDRDRIIREFRSGMTRILISTDVIARGFDQAQVTLVVNFDLPVRVYSTDEPDYEVYLHRIGRSGRFGRKGAAFNFLVTTQDEENMTKIEGHFQRYATKVRWDNEGDFENALKDAGLA